MEKVCWNQDFEQAEEVHPLETAYQVILLLVLPPAQAKSKQEDIIQGSAEGLPTKMESNSNESIYDWVPLYEDKKENILTSFRP